MNVPGNAAISFDTELTQTELEEKLNQHDVDEHGALSSVMEALNAAGISYPTLTVQEAP